jgi:hypothetical protein
MLCKVSETRRKKTTSLREKWSLSALQAIISPTI